MIKVYSMEYNCIDLSSQVKGVRSYIDKLKRALYIVSDIKENEKGVIYFEILHPSTEVILNIPKILKQDIIIDEQGDITIYDDYNE